MFQVTIKRGDPLAPQVTQEEHETADVAVYDAIQIFNNAEAKTQERWARLTELALCGPLHIVNSDGDCATVRKV